MGVDQYKEKQAEFEAWCDGAEHASELKRLLLDQKKAEFDAYRAEVERDHAIELKRQLRNELRRQSKPAMTLKRRKTSGRSQAR